MESKNTYIAIMAGGVGSRFWPQSRESRPKQFLDIMGTGESLLVQTFKRFTSFIPTENIYVVTSAQYVDQVKEHLPILNEQQILAEPSRRNTAPCIAYVSYKIAQTNPQANIVVVPSDHLIKDVPAFQKTIEKGISFVDSLDALVTLGIKPTRPDINYGYIQYIEDKINAGVFKVKTFTEKPNLEIAQQFLESGDFLWNAGIFLWNVQSILKAFRLYTPDLAELFEGDLDALHTEREANYIDRIYSQCKNISIDYAVMEKAFNVFVIPSEFGWSDLGTWTSLWDNLEHDEHDNAVLAKNIVMFDSENNMVSIPPSKAALIQGLEDFCIIDTEDAICIFKKDQEGNLKEYLKAFRKDVGDSFL